MPIYEYQCQECRHKLEVMQRMSDERLKTCPACQQDTLIKLISTVAFQLKGTGWYETDFKNNGKPAAAKDDAGKDGSDAGKDTDAASKSGGSDDKSGDSAGKSATADTAPSDKTTGAKAEKSAAKPAAKPAAE